MKKKRKYTRKKKHPIHLAFGLICNRLERGFLVLIICLFTLCGVLGTSITLTYNGEKAKKEVKKKWWEKGMKNTVKIVSQGVKISKMF